MKIHRFVFSPISVNTYTLAAENGDCAVIDCGCYDDTEFARLISFFEENRYTPVMLLNTHCHLDHIFGNGRMLERFGLKTLACAREEENLRSATAHAMLFGLDMDTPPDIGEYIEDGQIIDFMGVTLEAIYVPGHTAGSIAWYCREENSVFTGDALFAGGIGRSDLPGGNFDQLINNIKTRLLILPPETIVFPGHGESSTIGREKSGNTWLS
ncbi:MAG: MBL fold metallo-hydrolase [Bacteroidales bacterium]|nr:MBL fold metallo-hydrolase [Bacteroidales bacterium]